MSLFGRSLNLLSGAIRGAFQPSDLQDISLSELTEIERELEQIPQSQRPIDPAIIRAELQRRKYKRSGASEASGDTLAVESDSDATTLRPLKRTL